MWRGRKNEHPVRSPSLDSVIEGLDERDERDVPCVYFSWESRPRNFLRFSQSGSVRQCRAAMAVDQVLQTTKSIDHIEPFIDSLAAGRSRVVHSEVSPVHGHHLWGLRALKFTPRRVEVQQCKKGLGLPDQD